MADVLIREFDLGSYRFLGDNEIQPVGRHGDSDQDKNRQQPQIGFLQGRHAHLESATRRIKSSGKYKMEPRNRFRAELIVGLHAKTAASKA